MLLETLIDEGLESKSEHASDDVYSFPNITTKFSIIVLPI